MNVPGPTDTSDRIIYVALILATIFGIVSFFRVPAYEKGAWAVIGLVVLVVTNVMSFKFGVHQISPPAGTDQVTHTLTPPVPPELAEEIAITKEKE